MTARRKTRLVVRKGRMGVGGCVGSVEGLEREKRRGGGPKTERVPVPVLELRSDQSHVCKGGLMLWVGTCLVGARRCGECFV